MSDVSTTNLFSDFALGAEMDHDADLRQDLTDILLQSHPAPIKNHLFCPSASGLIVVFSDAADAFQATKFLPQ